MPILFTTYLRVSGYHEVVVEACGLIDHEIPIASAFSSASLLPFAVLLLLQFVVIEHIDIAYPRIDVALGIEDVH